MHATTEPAASALEAADAGKEEAGTAPSTSARGLHTLIFKDEYAAVQLVTKTVAAQPGVPRDYDDVLFLVAAVLLKCANDKYAHERLVDWALADAPSRCEVRIRVIASAIMRLTIHKYLRQPILETIIAVAETRHGITGFPEPSPWKLAFTLPDHLVLQGQGWAALGG